MTLDWEHVLQIRKARELSHPSNTSDDPSPASAGGGFNVPNLNDCEQLVFRMRAELIDYIEAHGLVDGLMWDGVLMPTQDRKIVISANMVDQLVARLGFMKEEDVRSYLEEYLPENNYVQDGDYVHTDNNFTDEEKAGLAQAIIDIADIKEHEETCDAETKEKFEEVDGRLGALEERADGFDKDISSIVSSCQSLDLRVSDLETDITRIDEVLDTHGSAINRLTASSQVIFGRVDKIDEEILGIKGSITDIDKIVSEHAEAIDGINSQLEGVDTDLSGIHTWMDATEKHQQYQDNILGTLNDRMDTNEEAIAALIKSDVDINEHLRQIDKDHRAITLTCQQIIQDVHALEDVVAENKRQSEAADDALRGSIAQEATDRAAEDSRLEGLINKETALRESNDNILKKAIEDEAEARGAAVAELDMKVEEEARIRKETDDELRGLINSESTGRVEAITELIEKLNQEIIDRTNGDKELNTKFVTATGMIADLSGRIDTEIDDINRNVELVNGAIAKEISDRETADEEIKAMISGIGKSWPMQRVGVQISAEDMTRIRAINGFHKFQAELTGGINTSQALCFGFIGHYGNRPQIYMSIFKSGYISYQLVEGADVGFLLYAGFASEGGYDRTPRTFEAMLSTEKEFNLENKILGLREIVISDEEIDLADITGRVTTNEGNIAKNAEEIQKLKQTIIASGAKVEYTDFTYSDTIEGAYAVIDQIVIELNEPINGNSEIPVTMCGTYFAWMDAEEDSVIECVNMYGAQIVPDGDVERVVLVEAVDLDIRKHLMLTHTLPQSLSGARIRLENRKKMTIARPPSILSIPMEDEIEVLMNTPDDVFVNGSIDATIEMNTGLDESHGEIDKYFNITFTGTGTTGKIGEVGVIVLKAAGSFVFEGQMVPYSGSIRIEIHKSSSGTTLEKSIDLTVFLNDRNTVQAYLSGVMVSNMHWGGMFNAIRTTKRITTTGTKNVVKASVESSTVDRTKVLVGFLNTGVTLSLNIDDEYQINIPEQSFNLAIAFRPSNNYAMSWSSQAGFIYVTPPGSVPGRAYADRAVMMMHINVVMTSLDAVDIMLQVMTNNTVSKIEILDTSSSGNSSLRALIETAK